MVQVSGNSQPKVWINGQYMPANKGIDGKWYVEIDGKHVEVDPNDLFGINSKWEELNQSFEEQKVKHAGWRQHWLDLQGKASSAYDAAGSAYKQASKKYNEVTQGLNFSELEGSQREEAKQYRADMSTAGAQKRRAVSDSIFYGILYAGLHKFAELSITYAGINYTSQFILSFSITRGFFSANLQSIIKYSPIMPTLKICINIKKYSESIFLGIIKFKYPT